MLQDSRDGIVHDETWHTLATEISATNHSIVMWENQIPFNILAKTPDPGVRVSQYGDVRQDSLYPPRATTLGRCTMFFRSDATVIYHMCSLLYCEPRFTDILRATGIRTSTSRNRCTSACAARQTRIST
jgi:hypothetical protein